jgi:hypothetical protein
VYLDHNKLRLFANILLKFEDTVQVANDFLQSNIPTLFIKDKAQFQDNQLAKQVCEHCYNNCSWNLELLNVTCWSTTEHRDTNKCLVTIDNNCLVKIRPLPNFRPQKFRICQESDCKKFPKCNFAHSEPEKRVWNRWLLEERRTTAATITAVTKTTNTAKMPFTQMRSYHERKKNPPPTKDMLLPVSLEMYRQKYISLLHYEEEEHIGVLKKKLVEINNYYIIIITHAFKTAILLIIPE